MIPLTQLVNRDGFGEWLNANGLVGTGVEIGVFHGEYSRQLLRTWAGAHLVGIDPYLRLPPSEYLDGCNVPDMEEIRDRVIAEFKNEQRYRLVLKRSMEAVEEFADGSLCFAYIDSNHKKEFCAQDLAYWWPKIQLGGVLGGHDLYNRSDEFQSCGVFDAVWEFAHIIRIKPEASNCTSYWFVKQ